MKNIKFILTSFLMLFAAMVFGQDSILIIHNGDTLLVPAVTTTIGEGVDYSKPAFEQVGTTLFTLLSFGITTLLVYLSYLFPGLRGLNVSKLNDPRTRSYIIAGLIGGAGFLGKFNDGGTWLSYALPSIMAAIGSSGLWEHLGWIGDLLKKWLGDKAAA